MNNPYLHHEDGDRRYEIVKDDSFWFRYTVYKYYGGRVYPQGSVVHVAATKSGAHRVIKRDQKEDRKYVVETVHG